MTERWLPVKYKNRNWPYQVSNFGRVKNKSGVILKPWKRGQRKGAYLAVRLCLYGYRQTVDIHRLVAIHFLPNPDCKPEVNHLDCNPFNPCMNNLEWRTRSENELHKHFMEGAFM